MKLPILDKRDVRAIYEEIEGHAKAYLPEWAFGAQDDPGTVVAKIWAELFAGSIERYNKMPYKHFLFFLNMLGANSLSGNRAGGFVTVLLNSGAPPVWIRRGTGLYKEGRERIMYETAEDIYAVDNVLEQVYCTDSSKEYIVRAYDRSVIVDKPFIFFDFTPQANLQKVSLSLADEVFHVPPGGRIQLRFCHRQRPHLAAKAAAFLGDNRFGNWQYYTAKGWRLVDAVTIQGDNLELELKDGLTSACYDGEESCWLSYTAYRPMPESEVFFTDILAGGQASLLQPEQLYANDMELGQQEFYPFGERISLYSDFYIRSDMVFSKRGAEITLAFSLHYTMIGAEFLKVPIPPQWKAVMTKAELTEPEVLPLRIIQVQWEYWNGTGWALLFKDGIWSDVFAREEGDVEMRFTCPADIEKVRVGAYFGYWLRARIIKTNQLFQGFKEYRTPVIRQLGLGFSYQGRLRRVNSTRLTRNLEEKKWSTDGSAELQLFDNRKENCPAAWFQFRNAMQGGPIKIYFQHYGEELENPPVLRWECYVLYNGRPNWVELKVLDETKALSRSGSITFYVKHGLAPCRIFGVSGYWIRAVNSDGRYDLAKGVIKRPKIHRILLNTVKIIQQQTMQSEYFHIADGERNKLCCLTKGNLTDYTVWVNEAGCLLADERHKECLADKILVVRSPEGAISEYWVKWAKVDSFAAYDGNAKVYRIDEIGGKILFGDGIHGSIPPFSMQPSIRIDYRISMGEQGNAQKGEIAAFADAVPFVRTVYNDLPVEGGCDAETVEAAISRSAKMLKVQNRSVLGEDYAVLARSADLNVVKVKVLRTAPGTSSTCIVIAILPKRIHSGADYFTKIRRNISAVLEQKAPLTLTVGKQIKIREVDYIEFSLTIAASVEHMEDYQEVMLALERRLEEYLDPIRGNFGKGFNIGELPSRMHLYHFLKATEKVKSIENLYISCKELIGGQCREIDYETALLELPFAVPVNGQHEINLTIIDMN